VSRSGSRSRRPLNEAIGATRPRFSSRVPGSWRATDSHTLVFTPTGFGFPLASDLHLELPRELGVSVGTSTVAPARTIDWKIAGARFLRLQQLLADAGHTSIGLLAGPDTTYTMRERRAGFRDAVRARTGLLPRAELLTPDHMSIEGGYAGLRRLLRLSSPPHRGRLRELRLHPGRIHRPERAEPRLAARPGRFRQPRARPTHQTGAQRSSHNPSRSSPSRPRSYCCSGLNGEGPDGPVTITLDTTLMVGHASTYELRRPEPART